MPAIPPAASMDAAGTGGTALQADGGAPLPLPPIAAGAAATGGAESVGGGGAFAVADGLLESPACRLLPPWRLHGTRRRSGAAGYAIQCVRRSARTRR